MISLLKEYINLISDDYLKCLTYHICTRKESIDCLLKPSSSSGLNHSKDESGEYGQLIHCLKATVCGINEARKFGLTTSKSLDIIIVSCLIHDIPHKFYYDSEQKRFRTHSQHGFLNAECFKSIYEKFGSLGESKSKERDLNIIYNCIFNHMGRWGSSRKRFHQKKSVFEDIVHNADYISSRSQYDIKYDLETIKSILEKAKNGF
jgi:hypothetical protein